MPKPKSASAAITDAIPEPLKIEFIWNDYLVIILRKAEREYVMDIFPPNNDGSFRKVPVHTVDGITNLMNIRKILSELFDSKVI